MTYKTCAKCGATKPLDDFHRKVGPRLPRDGHQGHCKDCDNLRRAANRGTAHDPARDARLRALFNVAREEWQEHGACNGLDPNLFHPEQGGDSATPKAICRTCPVETDCLDYALRTGQTLGVWGGKTATERKLLRLQRRAGAA